MSGNATSLLGLFGGLNAYKIRGFVVLILLLLFLTTQQQFLCTINLNFAPVGAAETAYY